MTPWTPGSVNTPIFEPRGDSREGCESPAHQCPEEFDAVERFHTAPPLLGATLWERCRCDNIRAVKNWANPCWPACRYSETLCSDRCYALKNTGDSHARGARLLRATDSYFSDRVTDQRRNRAMIVHHLVCRLIVTGGLESCDCNALEEATERRCLGCGARDGFISPLNMCEKCLASQSDAGGESSHV